MYNSLGILLQVCGKVCNSTSATVFSVGTNSIYFEGNACTRQSMIVLDLFNDKYIPKLLYVPFLGYEEGLNSIYGHMGRKYYLTSECCDKLKDETNNIYGDVYVPIPENFIPVEEDTKIQV